MIKSSPAPNFAKDFCFIPGETGLFAGKLARPLNLYPGATNYVPRYSDFDHYAQACIEGRA